MGYKLFSKGIFGNAGDIDATFRDCSLLLRKAAPGTLFVVGGVAICLATTWVGADYSKTTPSRSCDLDIEDCSDTLAPLQREHVAVSAKANDGLDLTSPYPFTGKIRQYTIQTDENGNPKYGLIYDGEENLLEKRELDCKGNIDPDFESLCEESISLSKNTKPNPAAPHTKVQ